MMLMSDFVLNIKTAVRKTKTSQTRNAWQSPAVARQAQRMHSGTPAKTSLASYQIDAPAAWATLSATRPFHFVHTAGML